MRFVLRKDKTASLVVLGLLAFSLLLTIQFAHALNSVIVNIESGSCVSCTNLNIDVPSFLTGNQLAVVLTGENTGVLSISDFASDNFVNVADATGSGFDGNIYHTTGWTVASSISTGTATMTIHSSLTATVIKAEILNLQNYAVSGSFFQVVGATANDADPGHTITSQPVGSVVIQSCAITGQDLSFPAPVVLSTLTSSTTVTIPSCGGQNGRAPRDTWATSAMAMAPTASLPGPTTVINTDCLGGCSNGNNGTSIYLPQPTSTFFNLHFYASQNLALAAQIDNITIKVAAVHITTNTGSLYFVVYGATGAPSGGNPYSLLYSNPVTLSNGTSNFFIHVNPQVNLVANQYYAAGIMSATTSSRGSGSSGSGVSVYETSQVGITEYKFAVGGATPPNSFYSNTVQTPRDFIYIHSTFTVATVTTTSTTTSGGTATTTVTTTSTNIVNQLNMSSAGFWFIPMIFLLVPMALFVIIRRATG